MPEATPGFSEPDALRYDAGESNGGLAAAVAAFVGRNQTSKVPWRLAARTLETAGYLPGDVLIVDLNARPLPGDAVCAQVYDFGRPEKTVTVMRIFNPPVLVGASLDPSALKPLMVDDRNVAVKGVIVASIRARGA